MRLIDADALLRSHCSALDGKYESCEECLKPPYGCCCLEIKGEDIHNAPTIDAIPVDWIEDMLREWHNNKAPFEAIGAVSGMLVRWYKEQEAQDG